MDGSKSFIVFEYFAFIFQKEDDDVFIAIFCCEMQSRVAIVIVGVCLDLVVE